jgi:hypothetical protein
MMAMHWHPDRRRRMGRPLPDHCHNALLTPAVTGYTRQALQNDDRSSVLTRMAPPVAGPRFRAAVIRWNNQGRNLLAVDDRGYRDFLA